MTKITLLLAKNIIAFKSYFFVKKLVIFMHSHFKNDDNASMLIQLP